MKNFLIIVVLSFIASLSAFSSHEEEMREKIRVAAQSVKPPSSRLTEEDKEEIVGQLLFQELSAYKDAAAFICLANHLRYFPDDVNFPGYSRQTIATTIINSLRDKEHPNFDFSLRDKKTILQSVASNIQKLTPSLESEENPLGPRWNIAQENTRIWELCDHLLSEKGQNQLMNKRY